MRHLLTLSFAVMIALSKANAADDPTISVVSAGTVITKMPGSTTDFDIFTDPTDPTSANASNLTNFSVGLAGPDGGPLAGGDTILAPNGDTIDTAAYYQGNDGPSNLIEFTLNNTENSFNFADFNVYVLISSFGFKDNGMSVTEVSSLMTPPSASTPVTDTFEGPTGGRVVEFNISGANAGDEFTIATTSPNDSVYLQGVSFESIPAPEPATYALMLGGVALVGFCVRRRLA